MLSVEGRFWFERFNDYWSDRGLSGDRECVVGGTRVVGQAAGPAGALAGSRTYFVPVCAIWRLSGRDLGDARIAPQNDQDIVYLAVYGGDPGACIPLGGRRLAACMTIYSGQFSPTCGKSFRSGDIITPLRGENGPCICL